MDYPVLTSEHLVDARLFATRDDMLASLATNLRPNPSITEVGVALGGFSKVMIDTLKPEAFYALDLFDLHHLETLWGQPTSEIFGGRTHEQYYRDKFPRAIVRRGDSEENLGRLLDQTQDLIYIDAGHSYEDVRRDAAMAVKKVSPSGIIIFNDYIMYDHVQQGHYGVVQAVNELVAGSDWRVIGFALQHRMFCDIAIQRKTQHYQSSRIDAAARHMAG